MYNIYIYNIYYILYICIWGEGDGKKLYAGMKL